MFKLTALLCAAMFAVFLIAGEDRGQLRPGLANAGLVVADTPAPVAEEPAPIEVAAEPSADVAPVDTPVTVEQVTTPETAAEIADTVFSLANYGDNPPADQSATASSDNVGDIGYVDAEQVNVREGPGTENPVLTRLNRGEAVTIVSTDASGWARIRIEGDGIEGFISMDYLSATP
jgi:mRNA-degrading endonuclease toxin of MazEF toxin-antitoxin module